MKIRNTKLGRFLSVFLFLCIFLNTFPIRRQDHNKLPENYNQNMEWLGFGANPLPTPTTNTDTLQDRELSSI